MDQLTLFFNNPANQLLITVLAIADLVLRGLALYKSARKEQKVWFVALLVVNSAGVLPLIYLLLQKRAALVPAKKTSSKRRR